MGIARKSAYNMLAILSILFAFSSAVHAQGNFVLTVEGFEDGGDIPVRFSQAAEDAQPGGGTSPEISWVNAPEGTRSFVVNMTDLDFAPNKGTRTQVHWVVWNIPGNADGLAEDQPSGNQLPNGASQISATGRVYRGPGAPATRPRHHYLFEVYALDTELNVGATDDPLETRDAVMAAMEGHVLGKSVYMGRFHRPQ
ncbi:MAG: YbhB/YbcL family Raf kinase inhibitor-like protein [Pseudohongiella sp.]|uniref:YbhB/YbcL family Raf kinase inhibitor-like protein n=1 Tax=Pseudohongiella sp. TaxID=1979412 RepID=UPI0034A06F3B